MKLIIDSTAVWLRMFITQRFEVSAPEEREMPYTRTLISGVTKQQHDTNTWSHFHPSQSILRAT